MGNMQLKRSHKYYTQVISQIALAKVQLCYFVVWTSKDLIVELIEPNDPHYQNVERSLSIFFRSYICPILLGYKELSFCTKCEKFYSNKTKLKKDRAKLIIIASSVISICVGIIISVRPSNLKVLMLWGTIGIVIYV